MSYPKEDFIRYLTKFTDLYTSLFLFAKPIVAALNGHTIGGGCMLSLACDSRIMASGKAKILLNEISFGSSVFAGSVEMLRFCVGQKNAEKAALDFASKDLSSTKRRLSTTSPRLDFFWNS